ncbi:hypothetical protein GX411_07815 [Candidatus Fermentibacteria bacterium]|nr:hypothetical protein [Candidatus Fermentibacteria bacterium]
MRRIVPILFLLSAACGRNPLLFRLGADYYPVSSIGSEWEYQVASGGGVITTVVDQIVMGERTCYRVQTGADYSYWISDEGRLEHYEDHRVMFNGYEVPVFQAWVTWLDWPLAVGASRTDSASTFAVSQGVTISHRWRRTTEVAGIGEAAGYEECYHLVMSETIIDWVQTGGFEPETSATTRDIWLAPDVGMVLKVTPDSTLTLVSYRPGS